MGVYRASVVAALAPLVAAAGPSACRAIEGLDGLSFDLGPDGGALGTCGESLPEAWSGPIAVYEGPPDLAPPCPPEYPIPVLEGGVGLTAPPATCGPCTCGAPQVTCTPGSVEASTHWGCNGGKESVTPVVGTCTPFSPSGDNLLQEAPQVSATCFASGGSPSVPAHAWTRSAVACGLAQGASSACPPLRPPFEARVCVSRAGIHPCPAQFPVGRGWDSLADTRGCAPCTCKPSSSGVTCAVTVGLFGDDQCQKHLADLGSVGQCGQHSGVQALKATVTFYGSAPCTPGGGAPVGAASAEQTLTICCTP